MATFPNLNMNKRAFRSSSNPMDRATIVSVFDQEIKEINHTTQPRMFIIPAGSPEKPSVTIVQPVSYFHEIDEKMPLTEVQTNAIVVAESIVKDYCNGIHCCDMDECRPGLFFVPGELSLLEVKKNHPGRLEQAIQRQKNWYAALVKDADILWARTNGNPLAITQYARKAATELGLEKSKPWMGDIAAIAMVNCPACGMLKNPAFPVCSHCKTVTDAEKYKELKLASA